MLFAAGGMRDSYVCYPWLSAKQVVRLPVDLERIPNLLSCTQKALLYTTQTIKIDAVCMASRLFSH